MPEPHRQIFRAAAVVPVPLKRRFRARPAEKFSGPHSNTVRPATGIPEALARVFIHPATEPVAEPLFQPCDRMRQSRYV